MKVTREFLGWTKLFLPAVTEVLVAEHRTDSPFSNALDLSHLIVVCPINRAKRRLLDLLARAAKDNEKVLIPPRLIKVGEIPETLFPDLEGNFAGESLEWVTIEAAINNLPVELRQLLLGPEVDPRSLRAFAEKVRNLRSELAGANLNFDMVALHQEKQGRDYDQERWQALSRLERSYLARIQELGFCDKNSTRKMILEIPEVKAVTPEIFLVGCADLNRLQRLFLEKAGAKITSLIFAPESIKARFDELGCLNRGAWSEIYSGLKPEILNVCATEQEEVEQVLRILKQHQTKIAPDELTIGLGNESLGPMLKDTLNHRGVEARLATAPSLAQSPPGTLLILLYNYFSSRNYVEFRSLLGQADLISAVAQQLNLKSTQILFGLDELYQSHLPERFELTELSRFECRTGLKNETSSCSDIERLLTAKLGPLLDSDINVTDWCSALVSLIDFVFGPEALANYNTDKVALSEALGELAKLLDGLLPAWRLTTGATGLAERWALLVRGLQSVTLSHPQESNAVETLGWLELQLDDAPNLIVTGFNEGYVPESINADQFLPNTLRQELGLLDNLGRWARDLFALESIIASRNLLGITFSQMSVDGEPLLPSRLALQVPAAELPERLRMLMGNSRVEAGWSENSNVSGPKLGRPGRAGQVERISVSGLNSYLNCPFRFYLQHVLELRGVDDDARELDSPEIGLLAHEVLCNFGRSDLRDSSEVQTIEKFLLNEIGRIEASRFGEGTHPAVKLQLEFLRARLRAFANWQAAWISAGWEIHKIEIPVAERGLPMGESGLRLVGRIDRIDFHPESGRYAVLDYKVREKSKTVEKSHRSRGAWKNLQLPAYRWMLRQAGLLPVSDWSQVLFGFLTLGADTDEELIDWVRWSESEFAEAEAVMSRVATNIRAGVFWPPNEIPSAWEDPLRWVVAEYERQLTP